MSNHVTTSIVSLVWNIADILRGSWKQTALIMSLIMMTVRA